MARQFNGIKVRLTNSISAGGGLAPVWVQVLGFTDDEMPPVKTPSGVIVLKVKGLSADGALNIDSKSYGFIVFVRKGVGIETEMFRLHKELVTMPYLSIARAEMGVDDGDDIPAHANAVISSDGGQTQMIALQDVASLEEKRRLKIHQLKFAKQASTVTQPCDTGDLHKRERHHAKHISIRDTPSPKLINPLAEDLQKLRDTGELVIPAKTLEHVLNVAIRLPTVLLK